MIRMLEMLPIPNLVHGIGRVTVEFRVNKKGDDVAYRTDAFMTGERLILTLLKWNWACYSNAHI